MTMDRIPMKVSDQIILHLHNFGGYSEKYKVPFQVSQAGIAKILGAHRSHISYYLKKLEAQGILSSRLGRIQGLPRKRKVYFLTKKGEAKGEDIVNGVRRNGLTIEISGKDTVIDVDEDTFANHKSSFLEKLLDKVERETADDEGAEGTPNYVLVMPGMVPHDSYRNVLSKWNLKRVEKAIDRSNLVVFTSKGSPEPLFTYVSSLAQEISKICNVFVYDVHENSCMEEFLPRFSRFLGNTGNYALEGIMNRGAHEQIWNELPRILRGLPFVVVFRGEWPPAAKMNMKEVLAQMTGMDVPLIIGSNDGDLMNWFKKKTVHLSVKNIAKGAAADIYGSIVKEGQGPLGEKEMKSLFREAAKSPLLLEAFGRQEPGSNLNHMLSSNKGFYSTSFDSLENGLRSVLKGLAGEGYPLIRGQMDDELSAGLQHLEELLLVTSTHEGFDIPPSLRHFLLERFEDRDVTDSAIELYERLLFLTWDQALNAIRLYLKVSKPDKALSMAVDWSSQMLDPARSPPIRTLFKGMDEKALSRESRALLRTIEGYGELLNGNNKKAWELAREAAVEGNKLKSESVLARSSYLKGCIHLSRGESRKALECMVTSFNLFKATGNDMGSSLSALSVARMLDGKGELNKALAYMDMALPSEGRMGSAHLIYMVHAQRGNQYNKKDIFSKASVSYGEAADMAAKAGLREKSLKYELLKGDVLVKEDHIKGAIVIFEKGVDVAEEQGLGSTQLKAYDRLCTRCFPKSSSKRVRYKEKAGHVRVLLKGATRMTRKK